MQCHYLLIYSRLPLGHIQKKLTWTRRRGRVKVTCFVDVELLKYERVTVLSRPHPKGAIRAPEQKDVNSWIVGKFEITFPDSGRDVKRSRKRSSKQPLPCP